MGISLQQFEQMKQRAGGVRRRPAEPDAAPVQSRRHGVVLGVDPSLRGTGYGIINVAGAQPVCLAQGTIKVPATWERSRCLTLIAQTLRDVIRAHEPTACAIEGLFYAQNMQTTLIMGEARGAALVAAGEAGLEIYELAPRRVKQAIVGYGAAQKLAVAKMVQRLLGLAETPAPDAADALAVALAYVQDNRRAVLAPAKRI
ncbi:MAG: crossover junction endodeoxyribonuclease RuvC [Verrucomicrobiota bacterium]|jgi:crossover junction endodeoxyribonuclease RuvC